MLLIILAASSYGAIYSFDEMDNKIKDKIKTASNGSIIVDHIEFNEDDSVDITLNDSKENNKIKLNSIKDYTKIKSISLSHDDRFNFTDVITIDSDEEISGYIYLEKYSNSSLINKILYSEDESYYGASDIIFYQNETHVWFEAPHFSSWTATMSDIYLFHDFLDFGGNKEVGSIDISDFAVIDGGHCISYTYEDAYLESTIERSTCSGSISNQIVYSDYFSCFGDEAYRFDLSNSAMDIYLDDLCDGPLTDTYSSARFRIYNEFSIQIAQSNQVDVRIKDFNVPDVYTYSAQSVSYTSATLRGRAYYNDLANVWLYDFTPDNAYRFAYRPSSGGTWTYTDWTSAADGVTESEGISGLSENTEYEYKFQFSYYALLTPGGDYEYIDGSIDTFTTLSSTPAYSALTVNTISPITGDTTAYFRALVDYNDYSGDAYLAFNYSCDGGSSFTRFPTVGWYAPNDGEIFTASNSDAFANDVQCFVYAFIFNTTDYIYGDTEYFTPSAPIGTNYTWELVFYDDFNDDSIDGLKWDESDASGLISETSSQLRLYRSGDSSAATSTLTTKNLDLGCDLRIDYTVTAVSESWSGVGSFSKGIAFKYNESSGTNSYGTHTFAVAETSSFNAPYEEERLIYTKDLTNYYNSTPLLMTEGNYPTEYSLYYFCNGTAFIDNGTSVISLQVDNYFNYSDEITIFAPTGTIGSSYNYDVRIDDLYIYVNNPSVVHIDTLEPNNITYRSATMRGSVYYTSESFNISDFIPGFRWRKSGVSEWTNNSLVEVIPENNSVFSYTPEILDIDVNYTEIEVQAFLHNYTSIYYGESILFNTSVRPAPSISTSSYENLTNTSVTLVGSVDSLYNRPDNMTIYFWLRKVGDYEYILLNQSINGSYINEHEYRVNLTNLTPETDYVYEFRGVYNYNDSLSGGIVSVRTPETGAPVIDTLDAFSIKRYEADLKCDILDLGIYSNVSVYFRYYNDTENLTTDITVTYNDGVEITQNVENLALNTTYGYECVALYGDSRNISGGIEYFKTLSLLDYIGPEISAEVFDSQIYYDGVTGYAYVELEDEPNATLVFLVYLYDDVLYEFVNSTSILINDSGVFTDDIYGLDDETDYVLIARLVYNSSHNILDSEDVLFTTPSVADSPKSISILGFDIFIHEPPKFRFLVMYMICAVFFIASISIILSDMQYGDILAMVSMILGVIIAVSTILWLYVMALIGLWFITICLLSMPILFIFVKGDEYRS